MASSLTVAISLAVVAAGTLWAIVYRYLVAPLLVLRKLKSQGVPGFAYRPLLGQLLELAELRHKRNQDPEFASSTRATEFLFQGTREFGPLWTWSLGRFPRVVVADPALARTVLVTSSGNFHKSDITRYLSLLGEGLVTSNGDLWARQRRLIAPAFHPAEIQKMLPTMVERTKDALIEWEAKVRADPGKPMAMDREINKLTLKVISETAFGMAFDENNLEVIERLQNEFESYFITASSARVKTAGNPLYLYFPTAINRKMWKSESFIRGAMTEILRDRLQKVTQRSTLRGDPTRQGLVDFKNGGHPDSRTDFLQLLIMSTQGVLDGQAGDSGGHSGWRASSDGVGMTVQQLMDECVTFMAAGHETVSNLLTWTMMLLGKDEEWQEKARSEVLEAVAGESCRLDTEALAKLKVVNWVLLESLRLYPPATAVIRTCVKDTRLTDKVNIPCGADIFVPVEVMHYAPEFWGENSGSFDPGRFQDGAGKASKVPGAFMPFGLGPRVCVGQNFALAEARAVLAMLLARFSWQLSSTYVHHPVVGITMRPRYGMPIIMRLLNAH